MHGIFIDRHTPACCAKHYNRKFVGHTQQMYGVRISASACVMDGVCWSLMGVGTKEVGPSGATNNIAACGDAWRSSAAQHAPCTALGYLLWIG